MGNGVNKVRKGIWNPVPPAASAKKRKRMMKIRIRKMSKSKIKSRSKTSWDHALSLALAPNPLPTLNHHPDLSPQNGTGGRAKMGTASLFFYRVTLDVLDFTVFGFLGLNGGFRGCHGALAETPA